MGSLSQNFRAPPGGQGIPGVGEGLEANCWGGGATLDTVVGLGGGWVYEMFVRDGIWVTVWV